MSEKVIDAQSEVPDPEAGFSLEMPRRDFLVLGSAALLGVATSSLGSTLTGAATQQQVLSPDQVPLSVGFWEGLVQTDYGVRRTWPLVGADSVRAGDRYFQGVGFVRVRVHGFWRASGHADPVSVTILPRYPALGFSSRLNVLSWQYVSRGRGAWIGSSRAFVVPMVDDGVLDLAIDRRALTPPVRQQAVAHPGSDPAVGESFARAEIGQILSFRSDDQPSALKLQRGTYVIAVGDRPDWSGVRIVEEARLLRSNEGPLVTGWLEQPVSFDYLVLSVDDKV
jgi:hypothetical protein